MTSNSKSINELISNTNWLDDKKISLGKSIGIGAQGEVYEIDNYPNKVIKFSTLYDVEPELSVEERFVQIEQVYNFIIQNNPPNVVKVFEFGKIKSSDRRWGTERQKYIFYYSIQERLKTSSLDEKKMLKTVCQLLAGELELKQALDQLIQLNEYYSFDFDKTNIFCNAILNCKINHNDWQTSNIMKDKDGNFKLIDFELANFK